MVVACLLIKAVTGPSPTQNRIQKPRAGKDCPAPTMPDLRAWSKAIGNVADAMLPWSTTFRESLLRREAGALDHRFQHAQIRLVRNQDVDVVHCQAVCLQRFKDRLRHPRDAIFKHLFADHAKVNSPGVNVLLQQVLFPGQSAAWSFGVEHLGAAAVGVQDRGENSLVFIAGRPDHDRTRTVAEQNRNVAAVIRSVDPGGEDFRAGNQDVAISAGCNTMVGDR